MLNRLLRTGGNELPSGGCTESVRVPQHPADTLERLEQQFKNTVHMTSVLLICVGVLFLLSGIALTCFGSGIAFCILSILFLVIGGMMCCVAVHMVDTTITPSEEERHSGGHFEQPASRLSTTSTVPVDQLWQGLPLLCSYNADNQYPEPNPQEWPLQPPPYRRESPCGDDEPPPYGQPPSYDGCGLLPPVRRRSSV